MPGANPPRKFAPIPVEHTEKSSRGTTTPASSKKDDAPPAPAAPRRFAPIPVEVSTNKSSRNVKPAAKDDEGKKAAPRRFAPMLVEESTSHAGNGKAGKTKDDKPHIRFKPEPVSTVRRSKKAGVISEEEDQVSPSERTPAKAAPRKFAPILLDTAQRSRRANSTDSESSQHDKTESAFDLHAQEYRKHISNSSKRKASAESDRDAHRSAPPTPATLQETLAATGSVLHRTLFPRRTHSFRMPELDTIESSESEPEDSGPPSPSRRTPGRGGSPGAASDSSFEVHQHATRVRESIDESFTHYLLELERKKAVQRLEEQALAAFPNADFGYEPPHHYLNIDDDNGSTDDMHIDDRPVTFEVSEEEEVVSERPRARHVSTADESWEQKELQRHAQEMQRDGRATPVMAQRGAAGTQSPWWRPGALAAFQDPSDQEMKSMLERARPPMLGDELVFARCSSPEPARFDPTQAPGSRIGSIHREEGDRDGQPDQLWCAHPAAAPVAAPPSPPLSRTPTPPKGASSSPSSPSQCNGLWGGFCKADSSRPGSSAGGVAVPSALSGLRTPAPEPADPFDQAFSKLSTTNHNNGSITPRAIITPAPLDASLARINRALATERDLDAIIAREYPDTFITQVFNYLSLGYPSLAWPFDAELSKISRIPISELRKDDAKASAHPRGYIRLGQDFEPPFSPSSTPCDAEKQAHEEEMQREADGYARWHALKLYVREWVRQDQNMNPIAGGAFSIMTVKTNGVVTSAAGGPVESVWGASARRGSWAI